jgi:anti-sigma B factor antagonist
MKFEVTQNGTATILTLNERKLDSSVSPELKAEFLLLCKPKVTKRLIVDMGKVDTCDSSGLSALLIADRTMREHGGEVRLANVHKKVMGILKISQLDRVFNIFETVDTALKA